MSFVNLKPLLPGHVLISPRRVAPRYSPPLSLLFRFPLVPFNTLTFFHRLSDLSPEEVSDLFLTVQRIGRLISRVYAASALNVAMQDGVDAGQSVPHVHCHVIPRKHQDLEGKGGNDAVYGMLEGEEGDIGEHLRERERERDGDSRERETSAGRPKFPKVDEESRRPRGEEEMRTEAEMLRAEMEKETVGRESAAL